MRFRKPEDTKILKERYIRGIYQGEDIRGLCASLNINLSLLHTWKSRDKQFEEAIKRAEKARSLKALQVGLDQLASGYEEVTDHEEWIEDRNGEMIKRKRTRKQVAPNLNALMKLANKYAPNEYQDSNDSNSLTIRITQKDRSLTIEERRKILEAEGSSDNQEVIELNDSDIRYLESLEVVPPTKDQDEDSGG